MRNGTAAISLGQAVLKLIHVRAVSLFMQLVAFTPLPALVPCPGTTTSSPMTLGLGLFLTFLPFFPAEGKCPGLFFLTLW